MLGLCTLLLISGHASAGDPACPSPGDCFADHGGMGCEDADCCNAVCAVDLFCCAVSWDSLCASIATGVCQPACNSKPCTGVGACSSDLNGDGNVDGADLGLLLGAWDSDPGGCPDFNCDGAVDGADLGLLLGDWDTIGTLFATCGSTAEPEFCGDDVNSGCDAPDCVGPSTCCTAHPEPGCTDPDCEFTVCLFDSFCCNAAWDANCAALACEFCTQACTAASVPVTLANCGDSICGDVWAQDGARDRDWYELDLSEQQGLCTIRATLTASFPATELAIVDDTCNPTTLGAGDGACPSVATACVKPGVYRIIVAHSVTNGFPCGGGQTAYRLDIDCDCASPCDPIGCGSPSAGDCCVPHNTPFCNDADCCEAVCSIVPFCCEVEWDANCAFHGGNLCGVCQTPGACCLPDGSCQQVSGPSECNSFAGDFFADAACEVVECATVCGEGLGDCCADGGHFGPGCNDADCCAVVCVVDGFCCNFQWDASCAEKAEELCGSCQLPGACCLKDGTCVEAGSAAECEALEGEYVGSQVSCEETSCTPICGPGAGTCFEPHPNPGCEDASCCFTVCNIDSYCCDTAWDSICTEEASSFCISCGESAGPICAGTDENEPCGQDTNGGCNEERSFGTQFGSIACGETVCGSVWADSNLRDTDWFTFTVEGDEQRVIVATLTAEFPNANLLILDTSCPPAVLAVGEGNCFTVASACLGPGEYRVFVSQGVFEGFPCGGPINYALDLQCTEEPCAADGCGASGTGSCCIAQKTPFCDDAECCLTVCEFDPICCQVEWDQTCADEAGVVCRGCS